MAADQVPRRLWAKDPTLWKGDPRTIAGRLGWLDVFQSMRSRTAEFRAFVAELVRDGFQHVLLLGMGGSSLSAEMLRLTTPRDPGFPRVTVLDSTVPGTVREAAAALDLSKTLLLVSSKSGTTLEVTLNYKTFSSRIGKASSVAAISDPGTPLEKLATDARFRRFFPSPGDVGGRFSALSPFGLLPAALMGIDIDRILDDASLMADACGPNVPVEENPAMVLGAVMGEAALAGRDKLTLLLPRRQVPFGLWAEQLIAESTGKEGMGILPVIGEPVPSRYGDDRLFVGPDTGKLVPSFKLAAKNPGAEFLRWEIATAVAGSILGLNPFDEPNVLESKEQAQLIISKFHRTGRFPHTPHALEEDGIRVFESNASSTAQAVRELISSAKPGDYAAILAYVQPTPAVDRELQTLRAALAGAAGRATSVGYGPRYLHSTGQLHKGGPNTGLFLLVTAEDAEDFKVSGERYTYGMLSQAQAIGDLEALKARGRRILRLHLTAEPAAALHVLNRKLES